MMALSQRSQGTRSRLLLQVEWQSCVVKMRSHELVQPKVCFSHNITPWASLLRFLFDGQWVLFCFMTKMIHKKTHMPLQHIV